ncbi:DUF397 domain-containing protein [Streptomyces sp. NBC_01537]|uniref:DUF397 domain-containing protein n=1 Tax=Streptomyces sp. NBC_01537 TaxID=2903896 RepID=UPI003864D50D
MKNGKTGPGAPSLDGVRWWRSSHSGGSGNCVEITTDVPGLIPIRDSKNPDGPVLLFTSAGFSAFVSAIDAGSLRHAR